MGLQEKLELLLEDEPYQRDRYLDAVVDRALFNLTALGISQHTATRCRSRLSPDPDEAWVQVMERSLREDLFNLQRKEVQARLLEYLTGKQRLLGYLDQLAWEIA